MNESHPQSPAAPSPSQDEPKSLSAPPARQFHLVRTVLTTLVLGGLITGGLIFFGVYEGADRIRVWLRPSLVVATGEVWFNGKPLPGAQVTAHPTQSKLPSSFGWCDEQGKFQFKTDIQGYYKPGAFVGTHQVTIIAYGRSRGAGPGPVLSPLHYTQRSTSPLTITAPTTPDKNHFKLELAGEIPSENAGGGFGDGDGPGGGGGRPGGRANRPGAGNEDPVLKPDEEKPTEDASESTPTAPNENAPSINTDANAEFKPFDEPGIPDEQQTAFWNDLLKPLDEPGIHDELREFMPRVQLGYNDLWSTTPALQDILLDDTLKPIDEPGISDELHFDPFLRHFDNLLQSTPNDLIQDLSAPATQPQ